MARMLLTPSLGCGYALRERRGQEEGSDPVVLFAQGITLSLGASYGTPSSGRLQRFCFADYVPIAQRLGRVLPSLKDFA